MMVDPRKEKRFFRKNGMDHPVYVAWLEGGAAADDRKSKCNPYPAGRRHDEWERGYQVATEDRRNDRGGLTR
jgi:hypothetical protein